VLGEHSAGGISVVRKEINHAGSLGGNSVGTQEVDSVGSERVNGVGSQRQSQKVRRRGARRRRV
jgi:hypothetical protein